MSDFVRRVERNARSRYAAPPDPIRRRMPLVWLALAAWFVWIGLLSDHSFWRIWRLSSESRQTQRELQRTRTEVARLESEMDDPAARSLRAEKLLRERDGMAREGEIVYRIQSRAPDTLGRSAR